MEECREYDNRQPLVALDRLAVKKMMKNVKGFLVLLPLKFLERENLAPPVLAKEGMVPTITWT